MLCPWVCTEVGPCLGRCAVLPSVQWHRELQRGCVDLWPDQTQWLETGRTFSPELQQLGLWSSASRLWDLHFLLVSPGEAPLALSLGASRGSRSWTVPAFHLSLPKGSWIQLRAADWTLGFQSIMIDIHRRLKHLSLGWSRFPLCQHWNKPSLRIFLLKYFFFLILLVYSRCMQTSSPLWRHYSTCIIVPLLEKISSELHLRKVLASVVGKVFIKF